MCGVSYYLLERVLIRVPQQNAELASAVGIDRKGLLSLLIYTCPIPLAFVSQWIAFGLYVVVAVMWFIPDPRLERHVLE